jgi:hypothetical protein
VGCPLELTLIWIQHWLPLLKILELRLEIEYDLREDWLEKKGLKIVSSEVQKQVRPALSNLDSPTQPPYPSTFDIRCYSSSVSRQDNHTPNH